MLPGAVPGAGVLHLPGGSQTVNPDDLVWWAERGFAAYSYDWENTCFAAHDPARKSVWPGEVREKHAMIDDARQAILPVAIAAAGAVIDWMCDEPRVDAQHLGVAGISWGGYLAWAVAAYDERVRALVPVFGCGGLFDPRCTATGELSKLPEAMRELWRTRWDALALAARINIPVCFLSSTNDFWGMHSIAEQLLETISPRVAVRRSSVPNQNHHTGAAHGALAAAWMAHHLRGGPPLPREPRLRDDLSIEADASRPIAERQFWWTPSAGPDPFHCWWPGRPPRGVARRVFGRVIYADGLTLNTATRELEQNPDALRPLPEVWPDPVRAGAGYWWGVCSTQFYEHAGPHQKPLTLRPVDGDRTRCRVSVDRPGGGPMSYIFRGLGDPRWNDGSIDRVRLTVEGDGWPITALRVLVFTNRDNGRQEFSQAIKLPGSPTRVELSLTPEQFEGLPSGTTWHDIRELVVSGDVAGQSYIIGPIQRVSA